LEREKKKKEGPSALIGSNNRCTVTCLAKEARPRHRWEKIRGGTGPKRERRVRKKVFAAEVGAGAGKNWASSDSKVAKGYPPEDRQASRRFKGAETRLTILSRGRKIAGVLTHRKKEPEASATGRARTIVQSAKRNPKAIMCCRRTKGKRTIRPRDNVLTLDFDNQGKNGLKRERTWKGRWATNDPFIKWVYQLRDGGGRTMGGPIGKDHGRGNEDVAG